MGDAPPLWGQIKTGCVNIHIDPPADLTLDVRKPLPFADGAFRIISSGPCLEHLDYPLSSCNSGTPLRGRRLKRKGAAVARKGGVCRHSAS